MYLKMRYGKQKFKSNVIKSSSNQDSIKWDLDWKLETWNLSILVFQVFYKPNPMKKICAGQSVLIPGVWMKNPLCAMPLESRAYKNDMDGQVKGSLNIAFTTTQVSNKS